MTEPEKPPATPLGENTSRVSPADGPWLEGPLPVAPPNETYEQYLERRVEIMSRLARDENLQRHFAQFLS